MSPYQSPYKLIQALGEEGKQLDAPALKQLRKRLLLELEMTGQTILPIGEGQLSKQDIMELFDRLEAEEDQWAHHQQLARHPQLLHLLESPRYDLEQEQPITVTDELLSLAGQAGFADFISPYLGPLLLTLVKKSWLQRDFKAHGPVWLQLYTLLNSSQQLALRERLTQLVQGLIEEVKRLEHKQVPLNKQQWRFLQGEAFYRYLNELPEELSHLRTSVAFALNDMVVVYQKNEVGFCYYLLSYLRHLECEEEIKKLIKENAAILKSNYQSKQKEYGQGSAGCVGVRVIAFAFIVIITFIRILSSEGCSTGRSSSYQYDPDQSEGVTKLDTDRFEMMMLSSTISRKVQQIENIGIIEAVDMRLPPEGAYAPYFLDYKPTSDRNKKTALFRNSTPYHAIIFIINKARRIIFVLPSGDYQYVQLQQGDKLMQFVGTNWSSKELLIFKSLTSQKNQVLNGTFRKSAPGGLFLLTQHFEVKVNPLVHYNDNTVVSEAVEEQDSTILAIDKIIEIIENMPFKGLRYELYMDDSNAEAQVDLRIDKGESSLYLKKY